jgi:hypothetical protein
MILAALDKVGGIDYLVGQAHANPTAFLTLLGKIMPTQVNAITEQRDITELTREELTARIREIRGARGKLAEDVDEPPQIH